MLAMHVRNSPSDTLLSLQGACIHPLSLSLSLSLHRLGKKYLLMPLLIGSSN